MLIAPTLLPGQGQEFLAAVNGAIDRNVIPAEEAFDRLVKCPHYRLVNNWDIVPGVPFPSPWGYRHTGDPRLLEPSRHPEEALRHDRDPFSRYLIDIWALAAGLISRKFLVVDDHMIWNYRGQLEKIAAARRGMLR